MCDQVRQAIVRQLVGGTHPRSWCSPGPGSNKACVCPLPDEVPLELCQGPEDMEHQLAA